MSRSGFAGQLTPVDGRAYAQRQQGYTTHADCDVDEQQFARDHTGDQQSDRDNNEKRTEANHNAFSPAVPLRSDP
jgi:hypothetical protein